MGVSIIGDSGSVFLPLYIKFRYSRVSAPISSWKDDLSALRQQSCLDAPASALHCLPSSVRLKSDS
jgi:hypothetical protein